VSRVCASRVYVSRVYVIRFMSLEFVCLELLCLEFRSLEFGGLDFVCLEFLFLPPTGSHLVYCICSATQLKMVRFVIMMSRTCGCREAHVGPESTTWAEARRRCQECKRLYPEFRVWLAIVCN